MRWDGLEGNGSGSDRCDDNKAGTRTATKGTDTTGTRDGRYGDRSSCKWGRLTVKTGTGDGQDRETPQWRSISGKARRLQPEGRGGLEALPRQHGGSARSFDIVMTSGRCLGGATAVGGQPNNVTTTGGHPGSKTATGNCLVDITALHSWPSDGSTTGGWPSGELAEEGRIGSRWYPGRRDGDSRTARYLMQLH